MKNRDGNIVYMWSMGETTAREMNKVYNEMAISRDKRPVSTQWEIVKDSNGGALRFSPIGSADKVGEIVILAVIYYEMKAEDNAQIDKETGEVKEEELSEDLRGL